MSLGGEGGKDEDPVTCCRTSTVTLLRLHPVADSTVEGSQFSFPASGEINSHGVTGGEYKTRERIHRSIADLRLLVIPASCSRVADYNPN